MRCVDFGYDMYEKRGYNIRSVIYNTFFYEVAKAIKAQFLYDVEIDPVPATLTFKQFDKELEKFCTKAVHGN